ncbi:MAG: hypothetical protein ACRD8Z_04890 [Nitrososphaeraceae archaeon]
MSKSIEDKLDLIINKLDNVQIDDEWKPVLDFCKQENLKPEWVLEYLNVSVDIAKKIKTRVKERENKL